MGEREPITSNNSILDTRYLYDVGLQNVFNDYQRNVATLDAQKQQELQDAYFIREKSRQYVGEYASNAGIGDVSGNLLDIYGNYQRNLQDIERNYSNLQLNLDSEYRQAQQGLLGAQLEQQYEDYQGSLATVTQNLFSGMYGLDEKGELVTDPYDYLERAKTQYNLNDNDVANLKYQLDYASKLTEANQPPVLKSYESDTYDPSYYYAGDDDIGLGSDIYRQPETNLEYVSVRVPVEEDSKVSMSNETLFNEWETNPLYAGRDLSSGNIISYRGSYYLFKDSNWYRMVETQQPNISNEAMKDLKLGGKKSDTLFYNGVTYELNNKANEAFHLANSDIDTEQKKILAKFKEVYGNPTYNSVVFENGRFWAINSKGNVVPMKKKE